MYTADAGSPIHQFGVDGDAVELGVYVALVAGVVFIIFENQVCADKDILLVWAEFRMGIDNTKENEGPGFDKALCSWFSGFAHESQRHSYSNRFAAVRVQMAVCLGSRCPR
jgi:hypothetical protein